MVGSERGIFLHHLTCLLSLPGPESRLQPEAWGPAETGPRLGNGALRGPVCGPGWAGRPQPRIT